MAGLVARGLDPRVIYALFAEVPQERRGCSRRRVPAAWGGGVSLRGHDEEKSKIQIFSGTVPNGT